MFFFINIFMPYRRCRKKKASAQKRQILYNNISSFYLPIKKNTEKKEKAKTSIVRKQKTINTKKKPEYLL